MLVVILSMWFLLLMIRVWFCCFYGVVVVWWVGVGLMGVGVVVGRKSVKVELWLGELCILSLLWWLWMMFWMVVSLRLWLVNLVVKNGLKIFVMVFGDMLVLVFLILSCIKLVVGFGGMSM